MIFSRELQFSTEHKFENTEKVFKPSTTDGVPFNSTLLKKWFPAYDFQKRNRKCADSIFCQRWQWSLERWYQFPSKI